MNYAKIMEFQLIFIGLPLKGQYGSEWSRSTCSTTTSSVSSITTQTATSHEHNPVIITSDNYVEETFDETIQYNISNKIDKFKLKILKLPSPMSLKQNEDNDNNTI